LTQRSGLSDSVHTKSLFDDGDALLELPIENQVESWFRHDARVVHERRISDRVSIDLPMGIHTG
jgi:hypothetical protein